MFPALTAEPGVQQKRCRDDRDTRDRDQEEAGADGRAGGSAAKVNSRNAAALTEFGHLVETFAVGEILKQLSWADEVVTASHFRTEAGDEVDLVLERDDGQVIAIEVKAGSRISGEDFRGLRQLKERLGPRLEEAIILHTGIHEYTHDDWITVLPLDRVWA